MNAEATILCEAPGCDNRATTLNGALWFCDDHAPVERPSLSDLADAAEVAWRNLLVAQAQSLLDGGCCSAPEWRGHLCEYHQGYADGIDAVLERMRSIGR